MKKTPLFLATLLGLLTTGCNNPTTDTSMFIVSFGHIRDSRASVEDLRIKEYGQLSDLVSSKQSFVAVTYYNERCQCWENFAPIVEQYVAKYQIDIKVIHTSILDGNKKYGIYTEAGDLPGICFFKNGKLLRQTIYSKTSGDEHYIFSDFNLFEEYMAKNIYLPKMYYIDEQKFEEKYSSAEDFNLYVARTGCNDCSEIDKQLLFKWSASKQKEEIQDILYVFDLAPYYAFLPWDRDPTPEEQAAYDAYIAKKKHLGLVAPSQDEEPYVFGFGKGAVPSFQRRHGSEVVDMITVLNDSADPSTGVVSSYFTSERIAASPMLRDTGEQYLFDGKTIDAKYITYYGGVKREYQMKQQKEIVEMYLDRYVK